MALTKALSQNQRIEIGRKYLKALRSGEKTRDDIVDELSQLRHDPRWEKTEPREVLHLCESFTRMIDTALTDNNALYVNKDIGSTAPGSQGPTLRQDFEPGLYALFAEEFGAWDNIRPEPADGPLHGYGIVSPDRGTAQFIQEADPIPTSTGGPVQKVYTPISLGVTSRGATWLLTEMARQSGTWFNQAQPLDQQMGDGMIAMAKLFSTSVYFGSQITGLDGTGAGGLTTPYGFTGLRPILENPAGVYNASYPYLTSKGYGNLAFDRGTGTIRAGINNLCQKIRQRGGRPSRILMPSLAALMLDEEARGTNPAAAILEGNPSAFTIGANVVAVRTVAGVLPVTIENDDVMGYYTAPAGSVHAGTQVMPVMVLDDRYITRPYIGQPTPSVFELEWGHDNNLSKRYIVALASGLAIKAPHWMGLVRVPVTG